MKIFEDAVFSKEEWEAWVKGEFNLFDNYAEKMGMTKEDAQRIRDKFKNNDKKPLTKKKNDIRQSS